jgi:aquaporin Z
MIKYVYEFIGTFFLVFTVGMTVMEPNSAGGWAPLAIGSALAVMVFAGGHISGGHYNPAVSFAVFLRKKLSSKDLGRYWAVQFLAGIVAAYLTVYFKGGHSTQPMLFLDLVKGFLAEFIFTFALCFVVLNSALARGTKGNSYFGWAIGFTVLIGAYAVGSISGGAFNPAVVLGVTLMKLSAWSNLWIFFAANLLGAACSSLIFKHAENK